MEDKKLELTLEEAQTLKLLTEVMQEEGLLEDAVEFAIDKEKSNATALKDGKALVICEPFEPVDLEPYGYTESSLEAVQDKLVKKLMDNMEILLSGDQDKFVELVVKIAEELKNV